MTLRRRDRIALGVVLVLGLLGAFYKLALAPERQKAANLSSQIASERAQLTSAEQSYVTGRKAQAALKADVAERNAIDLAVPSQPDIPLLLRTLQKTAKSVHVDMQAISLSGNSTATASTPADTDVKPASGPTPIPVQLTFAGGYTALNNLVNRLTGLVEVSGGTLHAAGPLLSIGTVSLNGTKDLTVQLSASIYQSAAASSTSGTTTGGQ